MELHLDEMSVKVVKGFGLTAKLQFVVICCVSNNESLVFSLSVGEFKVHY
jgi:hypothetical protein